MAAVLGQRVIFGDLDDNAVPLPCPVAAAGPETRGRTKSRQEVLDEFALNCQQTILVFVESRRLLGGSFSQLFSPFEQLLCRTSADLKHLDPLWRVVFTIAPACCKVVHEKVWRKKKGNGFPVGNDDNVDLDVRRDH